MSEKILVTKTSKGTLNETLMSLFFFAFGVMGLNAVRLIIGSIIKYPKGVGSIILVCFCIGIIGIIVVTFIILKNALKKFPKELILENNTLVVRDYFSTYNIDIYTLRNILRKRNPRQFSTWHYVLVFDDKQIKMEPTTMNGVDIMLGKITELTGIGVEE